MARINPSGWYVTSMESAQGQRIDLSYYRTYYSFLQLTECEANAGDTRVAQKVNRIYVGSFVLNKISGSNTEIEFNRNLVSLCYDQIDGYVNNNFQIFAPTGCTVNTGTDPRLDLRAWGNMGPFSYAMKRLNTITVRNLTAGSTTELNYAFQYDYFMGTASGSTTYSPIPGYSNLGDSHFKRLRLTGMTYPRRHDLWPDLLCPGFHQCVPLHLSAGH